jgi:4-amino-4-deoxy-L-arabinose transferase-like glycosyltransferase
MNKYLRYSILFALFHAIFFVIFLTIFRPIPGVDVAENYFWGVNFEWGYYKHPPLFAWVQEFFGKVFGISVFTSYFTAQTFIFITFISTFFLAKEFVGFRNAFFVILLLEALSFAGITSRTFNANLVQIPFWVLSSLFYLYGIKEKSLRKSLLYFALFGFFLGVSFLGKYFTLLLAFVIFVSFVSNKETRKLLKTPMPYLAVFVFFLTIFPHLIWLVKSGFSSILYIASEQNSSCSFLGCRLKYGGAFFISSILSTLPVIAGFFVYFKNLKFKGFDLQNPENNFLFCISVLPFSIITIVSLLNGMFILVKWSATFFFFLPIFLLHFWQFEERGGLTKRIIVFTTSLFVVWALVMFISGKKDKKDKGLHYKIIQNLAETEGKKWEKEFGRTLKIVAGETIDAGNFAMFSKERPLVMPYNKPEFANYISEKMLSEEGYLLLQRCETNDGCNAKNLGILKESYLTKIKKSSFFLQVIYVKPKL